jgi:hypothetical protein
MIPQRTLHSHYAAEAYEFGTIAMLTCLIAMSEITSAMP